MRGVGEVYTAVYTYSSELIVVVLHEDIAVVLAARELHQPTRGVRRGKRGPQTHLLQLPAAAVETEIIN